MSSSNFREKVLTEINLIPENKLAELYDFIHQYRLDLEVSNGNIQQIMQFAGSWKDMSDETFADFAQEIISRRQQAFLGRRLGETSID